MRPWKHIAKNGLPHHGLIEMRLAKCQKKNEPLCSTRCEKKAKNSARKPTKFSELCWRLNPDSRDSFNGRTAGAFDGATPHLPVPQGPIRLGSEEHKALLETHDPYKTALID